MVVNCEVRVPDTGYVSVQLIVFLANPCTCKFFQKWRVELQYILGPNAVPNTHIVLGYSRQRSSLCI